MESMLENHKESAPFDLDIEQKGRYQYSDDSRFSTRIAMERYTRMILSSTDFKGKSVLDVGSGDGTSTAELAILSKAAYVLGVEPSSKAVQRADSVYKDELPHLHFICGVSEMLLDKPERFDIAVYRGVIHHVADPAQELQNALTLARKVVILEPNGQNPLMKLVEKIVPYHRKHKERSYSMTTISRWISFHGGIVVMRRFFGLVPLFSPRIIACIGRWMEPFVERIPVVSRFCCGQYIVVASRMENDNKSDVRKT